jgi:uncharacterized membrane protein YkvA (DUF1232 family)
MKAEFPPQFDVAIEESKRTFASRGGWRRILANAERKGKLHYDHLLGAWETLETFVRLLRSYVTGAYRAPQTTVIMAGAAILYFLNPVDLIPDNIPVFGMLDDAVVITLVARMNLSALSAFRNWEATSRNKTNDEKIL